MSVLTSSEVDIIFEIDWVKPKPIKVALVVSTLKTVR